MSEEKKPKKCSRCGGDKFKKKGTYPNMGEGGEIRMWQCKTKGCGKCVRGDVIK